MNSKPSFKGVLFGVLAALALGFGAWPALARGGGLLVRPSGASRNQTTLPAVSISESQSPRNPAAFGSSPLVIPAAAFTSDGFDPDSSFFSFGGGYLTGNAANYGCVIAPAYLPQGATVTDMFASVYDNDASRNLTISFRRVDNFTGAGSTLATASTSGNFAGLQVVNDATISGSLITFPDYAYYVTVCLGSSDLRLYSVRLYYGFADLVVMKGASSNPANAGYPLTYTINIANTGVTTATAVTVTDILPPQLAYQSASASQGTCQELSGTVTCNLGDVGISSNVVVTIATTVNVFAHGMISNTAEATGPFVDGSLANNQATVTVPVRPPTFLPVITRSTP